MMATVIASGKISIEGCSVRSQLCPLRGFIQFRSDAGYGAAKLRWALECVDCDRKGRLCQKRKSATQRIG